MRKYWAVRNIRSIDGIPGLHIGRTFAGLPMTRDESKDNTRFHEPAGVVGSSKAGVVGVQSQVRGGWAAIVGAFVLGLAVPRVAALLERAYGSIILGL